MELNRKQIKSQARILVQNKWGALFVITFVVMVLTGMGMFNNSQINLVKQISNYNHASDYGSWDNREDNPLDEFDFDDQDEDDNPLEEFDGTGAITPVATSNNTAETMSVAALAGFGALFSLAALLLSPLNVTLDGYYVYFVRTAPPVRLGADLGQVFKNTFNKHYSGRLLLVILGGLFTFLWSLLLIIPGIVYSYGIYFANELMVDNPNLSPMEALKLSRRRSPWRAVPSGSELYSVVVADGVHRRDCRHLCAALLQDHPGAVLSEFPYARPGHRSADGG